jgi:hypothetical protein
MGVYISSVWIADNQVVDLMRRWPASFKASVKTIVRDVIPNAFCTGIPRLVEIGRKFLKDETIAYVGLRSREGTITLPSPSAHQMLVPEPMLWVPQRLKCLSRN